MPTVKRAKKTTQPKPKAKQGGPKRKVVYPDPEVKLLQGKQALTAENAKELLGWVEETEKVKFGSDYLLQDQHSRKVRCFRNTGNRIYSHSRTLSYMQDILRREWQFNGHNRIIGRTGEILSGQHVLPALILAVQEWEKNPEEWKRFWKTAPTIETFIAFGIAETDAIKNTIDTARESTLTDVLFRSSYFADLPTKDRKTVARMADYAVRILWSRTGASLDAFAPRRTHSESVAFIERHPKILDCVHHIREEDEENKGISRFVSAGYAAGFLFLMGSSTSDPITYHKAEEESEKVLDWTNWDKACDFFVALGQGSEEIKPMQSALGKILDSDEGATQREKWALLVRGWIAYAGGKKITSKLLTLKYVTQDEVRSLAEMPTTGGIDLGEPDSADEAYIPVDDPTKDEIADRGEQEKGSALVQGTRKGKAWAKGDTAWVKDPNSVEQPYFAEVVESPYETVEGEAVVVRESENEWEVLITYLHIDCPATD